MLMLNALKAYALLVLKHPALAAFGRVFLATLVACWTAAGMPIYDLTGADFASWVQLALQAAAALVIANYFGPWEKRYGRNKG